MAFVPFSETTRWMWDPRRHPYSPLEVKKPRGKKVELEREGGELSLIGGRSGLLDPPIPHRTAPSPPIHPSTPEISTRRKRERENCVLTETFFRPSEPSVDEAVELLPPDLPSQEGYQSLPVGQSVLAEHIVKLLLLRTRRRWSASGCMR